MDHIQIQNSIKLARGSNMNGLIEIDLLVLIFYQLEVVSSYRDPQIEVGENYS